MSEPCNKPKLPRGRPFPPGNKANPKGRPKLPAEVKALRFLTAEALKEALQVLVFATMDELKAILSNPDQPVLNRAYARALINGESFGDLTIIEAVLSRVVGRPVQSFDFFDADLVQRMAKVEKLQKERLNEKK